MADKPSTVGEYIAALPEHAAVKIAGVRQLVHETAPNLSETLKWSSPAFIHPDGMIMLVTSAHKTHINVVFSVSNANTSKANWAISPTARVHSSSITPANYPAIYSPAWFSSGSKSSKETA